jgi:parvulin-like peptidyl-prolyl isomerase
VLANINKQVEKQFYEEFVATLQKQMEVDSLTKLDVKLREIGSSIEKQKNDYREQMIAQTIIGQKVNRNPEITHDQLLQYYHDHSTEYDVAARARWEKMTARFDKFPSKAAAELAIVDMGNQVLRGADFAAVARKFSQGPNASEGGYHDWTTQGSLVSEVIDQAIFTLPVYQLSKILEDEQGFHIVRVIEREDAGRIEFVDAQDKIREKLQEEDRKRQVREYINKLRDVTYVLTVFDEQQPQR